MFSTFVPVLKIFMNFKNFKIILKHLKKKVKKYHLMLVLKENR